MNLKMCIQLLIWLGLLGFIESANILAIMPHVGKSHQLVFEPLFKQLVTRGDKLTLISRFPQKIPTPKWRDVSIAPEELNSTEILSFDLLTKTKIDRYAVVGYLGLAAYQSCKEGLSHPNYQKFLKEDNHFDLILIEVFNTPCFMGISQRFKAPVIGLASSIWMPWMYRWYGASANPAYVPNHFLGYTDEMSFTERVENTVKYLLDNLFYNVFVHYPSNILAKKYAELDGDMTNVSLLLLNTHYTLNVKTTLSPNTIEIGGIHVENQKIKPLSQDFEKFVNESKHGVIYMSMGSTIRGDTFPESKKQEFFKVFSRLPQRVIWKWEGNMQNKPDNVMIYNWTPQRDLLCHPNVKVFISHSGLSGIVETVDCGTPVLMIPLFGDQFTNAATVEKNGGGLVLQLRDITEENLYEKLQKLLSPKYTESAQELSRRFKDRPMTAMDTAMYWIDYVLRNNGAHFMKLASVDLPFYQYYLLDVIVFLFVLTIIYLYLFYLFIKFVFRNLSKKQEKIKKF